MRKINKENGMSLIEILLYFGILSVVMTAVLSFSIEVLNLSGKSNENNELQSNGEFIFKSITSSIQAAESVNDGNSIFNNDSGKISLNTADPATSPTNYYLDNGSVFLSEGAEAAIQISSELINCTQLKFTKVTVNKAPDQIVMDLACEPINTNYNDLFSALSLHTSINLRK